MAFWKTVYYFLKSNGIHLPIAFVKRYILSHSEYPGVSSMIDLFTLLNIKCVIQEVSKTSLNNLAYPFLGHTVRNNVSDFEIVRSKVQLIDNRNDFYENWDGIILTIEKESLDSISELKALSNKKNRNKIGTWLLAALFGLIVLFSFGPEFNIGMTTFFILNLTGFLLCLVLASSEFDNYSSYLEKLCSSNPAKTCIQFSKDYSPKFLLGTTLADWALMYFLSLLIWGLISAAIDIKPAIFLSMILPINILSIPFVFYSIWKQAFDVEEWCRFCLYIDLILILEAILGIIFFDVEKTANIVSFIPILLICLAFSCSWLFIKSILLSRDVNETKIIELLKIQYSPKWFLSALLSETFIGEIILKNRLISGNVTASTNIVIVTNPYCYFCGELHGYLEGLLDRYAKDVSIEIIFSVDEDENSLSYRAAQSIVLAYKSQPHSLNQLLKAWFRQMELASFNEKYNINGGLQNSTSLKDHTNWCKRNQIEHTPALIYNGYLIPKELDLKEFCYLIPTLLRSQ